MLSCRITDGSLAAGQRVRFMHTGREYEVHEVGYNRLRREKVDSLPAGAVGYVITGIKTIRDVSIGDTLMVNLDRKIALAEQVLALAGRCVAA